MALANNSWDISSALVLQWKCNDFVANSTIVANNINFNGSIASGRTSQDLNASGLIGHGLDVSIAADKITIPVYATDFSIFDEWPKGTANFSFSFWMRRKGVEDPSVLLSDPEIIFWKKYYYTNRRSTFTMMLSTFDDGQTT